MLEAVPPHPAVSPPPEVLRSLESWRRIVVIGHVVPDADCLGSMFALAGAFHGGGGRLASVSLPEHSLSQRLTFLWRGCDLRLADGDDFAHADAFAVLDTAKKGRCNVAKTLPEDWIGGRPVLNIDHHASNTRFGSVNWIAPEASSSCELVYRLLRGWDRAISAWMASLLYAGIHSDTGGFSLATTTTSALAAAAELVACGADVAGLGERLCRSQRLSEFVLLRTIYANTVVTAGGRIAYSTADHEEIIGAGCTAADIDDQVSVPRSLNGVRLAMLFTEGVKGKTRINFRGEPGVPVLELAATFGGGGHTESAGAIVTGPVQEVVARVLPRAEEHLDRIEQ
jgi:phosphoesterase RecJ-like protein